MKKLFVGMCLMLCLIFGMVSVVNAGVTFGVIECKKDSFTNETSCMYRVKNIKGFDGSYILKIIKEDSPGIYLTIYQSPKNWDLLHKSRIILFKIDGVLHKKDYRISTTVGRGYVIEYVGIKLPIEFASLIANSKECKIRVGCCKETFINQVYKDAMKELLLK